jgi:hypothetical protein
MRIPRREHSAELVRQFHLEAAPAPQHPGPKIGPQEVFGPRLCGDRRAGTSLVRIRRGHGFPAVDVLGAHKHHVIGRARPGQDGCNESCGSGQNPGVTAMGTVKGNGEGFPLAVHDGDGVYNQVQVRVAGGAPGLLSLGLVSGPREVGA